MATLPTTMKEAHISAETTVSIHDVPIPVLTHPHSLLVKVAATSCNPKDWKMAASNLMTIRSCPNSGDDIAGTVVSVGPSVLSFKPGDRVAALHELGTPHGSYAEYAVVYEWTTFHLDDKMPFEEACTVPMATYMGVIGLCGMLRVKTGPWDVAEMQTRKGQGAEKLLLVYGASSAVGAAVIKLAGIMGVHPLICVVGRGGAFVESLIDRSKGDVSIDYRQGPEKVVEEVKKVLGGRKLEFVFDGISEKASHENYWRAMDLETGRVTFVLGGHREDIPEGIEQSTTMVGSLWKELQPLGKKDRLGMGVGGKDFGFAYSRLIGSWLQEGKLNIHPFEVVEGGLAGLEKALKTLREGKSSATKFVIRIAETPNLKRRHSGV
ncbi:related to NADPH:quinone reductase and related Zn-dependent oxidoreductases [Phialocephala subalpina]|uniref:Related to NADPH:quinone reductase and related Zn-dependent oxidoreductases n=1 Tax=Phialocephala subalpina TaxID=576137 RepID=A0A1L7XGK8_9HELO|nr:related to NADPH:quinone reductase and related Zn-dependent oxidoreductases [Phialocephala subalpina]